MINNGQFLEYIKELKFNIINNIVQLPCAFDIETSSFYENGEKRAIMYIWMFGIGRKITYGRTWIEFKNLLDEIKIIFNLDNYCKLLIFVHNLSYEFGFMENEYIWDKVFAIKPRKILSCNIEGYEFRCSYLLTGLSLDNLSKTLKSNIRKKVGFLDYDLIRNSKTKLTKKELVYCEYDVKVLLSFLSERSERDGGYHKIPLTKTSYVRSFCREKCIYKENHSFNADYKNIISELTLTENEYLIAMKAFAGGFTHANYQKVGRILHNVHSKDFTSSYPAQAIYNYYPMSKGRKVKINSKQEFNFYIKKYCCIFEVMFEGLEDNFYYDNYLSYSKCKVEGNRIINNGRLVSADIVITSITEIDYNIIKKCYRFKKMHVRDFYIYKKGYLPKELVLSIINFYNEKTKLKGVEGMEDYYLNNKEMLNAIYGMMVTNIIRDIYYFNGKWGTEVCDLKTELDKYNKSKRRFLSYLWGIYITAHSREYLWDAIFILKQDYIYSDTDSVKYTNHELYEKYFEKKNKKILYLLKKSMEYHKLDINLINPKNSKGENCPIGVWDDEGTYDVFKTMGAKRYMTYKRKKDEFKITIAGLNKKIGAKYLREKFGKFGAFYYFTDDMYIPPENTGKLCMTYNDNSADGIVTDYLGNSEEYHTSSFIHSEKEPYVMSLAQEFKNYMGEYYEG